VHSCTGAFDIAPDGRRMVWYPSPAADMDVVRNDILGRLFSIGLHAGGALCLHGSGVAFDGETAAFLAPKGYGKSTLAGALIAAGARLVSDDTLAVTVGDVPMLQPGVHHLRLRSDSARHALEQPEAHPRGIDGKLVVSDLGDDRLLLVPRPLSAIYVLDPAPGSAERAVVRTPLAVPFAAVALVQHVKSAVLLGPPSAPALLDRAARVVRHVPVFRLQIARSLARLAEVTETLAEWHGSAAPLRATGS
jgi:hypothetical protein